MVAQRSAAARAPQSSVETELDRVSNYGNHILALDSALKEKMMNILGTFEHVSPLVGQLAEQKTAVILHRDNIKVDTELSVIV